MAAQNQYMKVTMGTLPEGFCPTVPQDLANAIAARIIVQAPVEFSTFASGSVEPTSNQGPWLNPATNTWWVWDDDLGRYKPMGANLEGGGVVNTGSILPFAGLIADIPEGYLFCNGAEFDVGAYPTLFGVIANIYGGTACCTFKIPDLRDYFIVGARADVGGAPTSNVSDGATPLQSRAFTNHVHSIAAPVDYPQDGTNFSPAHILVSVTGNSTTRALPPFYALAMMIKT